MANALEMRLGVICWRARHAVWNDFNLCFPSRHNRMRGFLSDPLASS